MIKPNREGIEDSISKSKRKPGRLVFFVDPAYVKLWHDIARVFGRSMTEEFKLAVNRRALEVGLPPVNDQSMYLLLKEYQVYPTDGITDDGAK